MTIRAEGALQEASDTGDAALERFSSQIASRHQQRVASEGPYVPPVSDSELLAEAKLQPAPTPEAVGAAPPLQLGDLLRLGDAEFVEQAYLTLLKRPPDAGGRAACVSLLDLGCSRRAVLAMLRYSPEGRSRAQPMAGLIPGLADLLAYKAPVLGGALRLAVNLLFLNTWIRDLRAAARRENP
ncbi:MAG: hypothetical protein AAGA23_07320 [Pseudomonadota bacterium]